DLCLLETDADNSVFSFTHTPKPGERAKIENIANRKAMAEEDFAEYENMFRKVHDELKLGKRKLQQVVDAEQKIFEKRFYLLDGLLLYLESINFGRVEEDLKETTKSRRDGRTEIIFENGTKSNMLYRSLTKQLYKGGKLITDTAENIEDDLQKNAGLIAEEDVKSGWIYVLKSKSANPKISKIKDLYK